MNKVISIGNQGFDKIIENNYFYVDKTAFIKEWWESGDDVTLITRPRRFGKTLNMDMLKCFFSNEYAGRSDMFEGLSIWNEEKYRKLQGQYPVIFVSFADVKERDYESAVQKIKRILVDLYIQYEFLKEKFSDSDLLRYQQITYDMDNVTAQDALKNLSALLDNYYGKRAIILLDEYDTPMQEAYIHGYWEEFTGFMRSMFNATFKTNPYLERAVMTGITRVSKESRFSDLNNLRVVTATSEAYSTCFGFTEKEVFAALDSYGMSGEKEKVKTWYDGFVFGTVKDIYNPWSITGFLKERKYQTYWVATSSNGMVSKLIQTASSEMKTKMAEQTENYVLKSNRESGFGRYDVMMIPKKENLPAVIMEFKVHRAKEKDLEETVRAAKQQIEEKNYDAKLLALRIQKERIRHYGFAFEGKKVLIG